jgi:hypothetical protein
MLPHQLLVEMRSCKLFFFCLGWPGTMILLTQLISKVLLKHSHTHLLTSILNGMLQQRSYSLQIFTVWHFVEKVC